MKKSKDFFNKEFRQIKRSVLNTPCKRSKSTQASCLSLRESTNPNLSKNQIDKANKLIKNSLLNNKRPKNDVNNSVQFKTFKLLTESTQYSTQKSSNFPITKNNTFSNLKFPRESVHKKYVQNQIKNNDDFSLKFEENSYNTSTEPNKIEHKNSNYFICDNSQYRESPFLMKTEPNARINSNEGDSEIKLNFNYKNDVYFELSDETNEKNMLNKDRCPNFQKEIEILKLKRELYDSKLKISRKFNIRKRERKRFRIIKIRKSKA